MAVIAVPVAERRTERDPEDRRACGHHRQAAVSAHKSRESLNNLGWTRRLLADIGTLRESGEYSRLWLGGAISGVGSQMTAVTLPIQIYALTHSSLAVGLLGLALALPLISVGLLGGSLAETVDRRSLVLVTSSLLAVVSLLFALQAFLGLHQVWLLYLLATLQAGLVAIDAPARRSFVPRLLAAPQIPAAAALAQLSFQVSLVAGPLLAGVLIASGGLKAAYLADAASFLAALYGVLRLRPMKVPVSGAPGVRAVVEGLRFVRYRPILAMVLLADLNGTIFGMPHALFPALATTRFHGGPGTVALLYAAPAIGGLVSAIFSGSLAHLRHQGLAVLLSIGVWGGAIAGFGLSPVLWLAMLLLGLAGAADVINGVFRVTILQVNTPDALQGRVNSLGYVVGVAGPRLGDVEAGVVAAVTSPAISAVAGGVACVAGVVLLGLAIPAFARYQTNSALDGRGR